MPQAPLRLPYSQILQTLHRILLTTAMHPDRARLCAQLFNDANRDGIPSHGLNRFPGFVDHLRENDILPNAEPSLVQSFGALERWDGNHGPGPANAHAAMNRAIQLARQHGIGAVALRNTNHWMRAGNYGWQAADANCIGICWTNTWPLIAPWGGKTKKLGNNPLVIAVPRGGGSGEHIVLDMAMSQYSMGKLAIFEKLGVHSPTPAGFDPDGNITSNPSAVINGGSAMPIGLWKGASLALMLDLVATLLSAGLSSTDLGKQSWEHKVSQFFLAIDAQKLGGDDATERIIAALKKGEAAVLYPGERVLRTRRESLTHGVEVDPDVWKKILALQPAQDLNGPAGTSST
ncbi:MAG: 3-dehydro-L-gulonate 2-dehydrogenase [Phycisphaerae bacterium]